MIDISTAIKETRIAIQAEKEAIAVHEQKIKELSQLVTQYLAEKKKRELTGLDYDAKLSLDNATKTYLHAVSQNEFSFQQLQYRLCRQIDSFTFGTSLARKLREAQCYYVWQAAIHSRQYWEKCLSSDLGAALENTLARLGLPLGLDYVRILLETIDNNSD